MLCFFFSLNKKNIIHPDFFHTINGTFILELLTKLLKVSKSYITEQSFASMDAGSQSGKVFCVVGCFYASPVYRQVLEKIFEDRFRVFSISLEQFLKESGIEVFIKNERRSDFLHNCNFLCRLDV